MGNKPILAVVAVLVIVGSSAWLYWQMPGRKPDIQMAPYQALGEIAAEEAGRLAQQKGLALVIAAENPGGQNPVEEARVKACCDALERAGLKLDALERFNIPPAARMFGSNVPRDWFQQVTQAHAQAAIIILFGEFPILEPADLDRLKQSKLKILLVSGNHVASRQLLDTGVIQEALVPRAEPPSQTEQNPQGTRAWFDRYYSILTPAKSN